MDVVLCVDQGGGPGTIAACSSGFWEALHHGREIVHCVSSCRLWLRGRQQWSEESDFIVLDVMPSSRVQDFSLLLLPRLYASLLQPTDSPILAFVEVIHAQSSCDPNLISATYEQSSARNTNMPPCILSALPLVSVCFSVDHSPWNFSFQHNMTQTTPFESRLAQMSLNNGRENSQRDDNKNIPEADASDKALTNDTALRAALAQLRRRLQGARVCNGATLCVQVLGQTILLRARVCNAASVAGDPSAPPVITCTTLPIPIFRVDAHTNIEFTQSEKDIVNFACLEPYSALLSELRLLLGLCGHDHGLAAARSSLIRSLTKGHVLVTGPAGAGKVN